MINLVSLEIVPFKIKAKEALALIEAENNKNK
jgi:hypothetical protein